jgi:hypothetical protein
VITYRGRGCMGTGRARQMARAKAVGKQFRQVALVRQLQPRKTIWSGENLGFRVLGLTGGGMNRRWSMSSARRSPGILMRLTRAAFVATGLLRQHGEGLRKNRDRTARIRIR